MPPPSLLLLSLAAPRLWHRLADFDSFDGDAAASILESSSAAISVDHSKTFDIILAGTAGSETALRSKPKFHDDYAQTSLNVEVF